MRSFEFGYGFSDDAPTGNYTPMETEFISKTYYTRTNLNGERVQRIILSGLTSFSGLGFADDGLSFEFLGSRTGTDTSGNSLFTLNRYVLTTPYDFATATKVSPNLSYASGETDSSVPQLSGFFSHNGHHYAIVGADIVRIQNANTLSGTGNVIERYRIVNDADSSTRGSVRAIDATNGVWVSMANSIATARGVSITFDATTGVVSAVNNRTLTFTGTSVGFAYRGITLSPDGQHILVSGTTGGNTGNSLIEQFAFNPTTRVVGAQEHLINLDTGAGYTGQIEGLTTTWDLPIFAGWSNERLNFVTNTNLWQFLLPTPNTLVGAEYEREDTANLPSARLFLDPFTDTNSPTHGQVLTRISQSSADTAALLLENHVDEDRYIEYEDAGWDWVQHVSTVANRTIRWQMGVEGIGTNDNEPDIIAGEIKIPTSIDENIYLKVTSVNSLGISQSWASHDPRFPNFNNLILATLRGKGLKFVIEGADRVFDLDNEMDAQIQYQNAVANEYGAHFLITTNDDESRFIEHRPHDTRVAIHSGTTLATSENLHTSTSNASWTDTPDAFTRYQQVVRFRRQDDGTYLLHSMGLPTAYEHVTPDPDPPEPPQPGEPGAYGEQYGEQYD